MEKLLEKPEPGMAASGQLIRAYRMRAGLGLAEAASLLEVDKELLKDIESAKRRFPRDNPDYFNRLRSIGYFRF